MTKDHKAQFDEIWTNTIMPTIKRMSFGADIQVVWLVESCAKKAFEEGLKLKTSKALNCSADANHD